jgi:hypothetical protein
MIAVIPARLEHERLSAGEFNALASESLREMGVLPETTDYVRHIDAQPRGRPLLLAELRRDSQAASMLLGTRLPPKGDPEREKPQYVFSTTTLLLLRSKALTLTVTTGYDGAADLDWIRAVTLRWVDELLRLNRNP